MLRNLQHVWNLLIKNKANQNEQVYDTCYHCPDRRSGCTHTRQTKFSKNKQIIKKAVGDHRSNASVKRNPHLFDRAQQRTHRHRKHLKRISKPYNAQIGNSNLLDFRFIRIDAHDKFRCKKRKTGKQQPDAQHKQKRKPIRAGDPVIILRAPVLREKEHAASDKPPVAGKHQA